MSRGFKFIAGALLGLLGAMQVYDRVTAPDLVRWDGIDVCSRGSGDTAVLVLHGYASSARDGVIIADELARAFPARYLVLEGPIPAVYGQRAWYEWDLRPDGTLVVIESQRAETRRAILAVMARARAEGARRVVVAGVSEGARMAMDVALAAEPRADAVVFLAGSGMESWRYERAEGLPIFMAHGRADPILPFDGAEEVRDFLRSHGARVTWFPYEGGHFVDDALAPAGAFLTALGREERRDLGGPGDPMPPSGAW